MRDQSNPSLPAYPEVEHPPAAIDLIALVGAALRRWKLIATMLVLAIAGMNGILRLMPTLYQSDAEILVFDPESQLDDKVQAPISPFRSIADDRAMNTEIEVLKSKSVALRVATDLNLDHDPEFQPHTLLSTVARTAGLPQLLASRTAPSDRGAATDLRARRLDAAAGMLQQKLKVQQIPFSYILSISMTSVDPVKAQHLTATIANDFLALQREERQDALQRAATWLKARVDDLQSRILETEAAIEKLKADSGLTETAALAQNVKDQQIQELDAQLMKARADVAEKHAHYEQARAAETNGNIALIPELMASPVMTQLRQQQAELNLRENQLRAKLGPNHAQVIALDIQLADINRRLNDEAGRIIGDLQQSFDIAVRQEQSLGAALQKLTTPQNDSPATLKLRNLQRTAETDRKLHESYLTQYNEASQRLTLQEVTARIITPATLPAAPSSPRRTLFYALGAIMGLGGGLGLALLLELLKPGVKSKPQVEQAFGYPVLGAIPIVPKRQLRHAKNAGPARLVVDAPLSQLSESVRAMRIGMEISNPQRATKVILVTSPLPAEGKSTTAMLLAASSAMSGRKTVLVDCDLRHQAISGTLRQTRPGLSELLCGTAPLTTVVTEHPIAGIDVIPTGSMVRDPADLLMSQPMRDLADELRQRYDYVVMDGPPLLPVVDALALATIVDKILVIVEWSRTPRASIAEAFKILRPEQERIAGIVLNKVDPRQMHGYGYGGGRGYRYRSFEKYLVSDAR